MATATFRRHQMAAATTRSRCTGSGMKLTPIPTPKAAVIEWRFKDHRCESVSRSPKILRYQRWRRPWMDCDSFLTSLRGIDPALYQLVRANPIEPVAVRRRPWSPREPRRAAACPRATSAEAGKCLGYGAASLV